MPSVAVAVLAFALASACGGDSAAVIEVRADDLSIPTELSAFCLGAFDDDETGGQFGRVYQFDDQLTELPQTLTIEPGSASSAFAIARGYRAGVEVARDSARLGFDDGENVALNLSRCPIGGGATVELGGSAALGGEGRLATSVGRGGSIVVGVGAGVARRFRATTTGLEALDGGVPAAPTVPDVLIAFDADGDCDDDLLLADESGIARLWVRDGELFSEMPDAFAGAASSARAGAVADVDADGDIDVVLGGETSLLLWKNDGAGRFSPSPGQLATDADSDVTALAFVELDGDGIAELLVARGREAPAPVRLLAGQAGGGFIQLDAATPEVALQVVDMAVRDFDGDRVDDVALAVVGGALRVFAGRGDGRLEDRSFLYFPDGAPDDVTSVVAADWDGDCLADAVVSSASGTETFRGSEVGFALEGQTPPGLVADIADVDDDGDFDVLLIDESGGVSWLRR